jgi:DNA-binding transcriptional LysR family regulator
MTTIKKADREPQIKIEWLHSFLAVTDTGGFTKAARTLHLSQPAVSTHVRGLETLLGARLFEQMGGRVRLTRTGAAVAREARRLLEDVRELKRSVTESEGGVEGAVKIGASTTPGNYLIPGLLGEFERKYPRARAVLTIGNSGKIMDLLRVNDIDLAVVGLKPDPREFVSKPFAEDEIVFFAATGHPLARRRSLVLADLASERLLLRERESATRKLVEAWLTRRQMSPPVMELSCPETIKRAAAAGLGVGMLSKHAIEWETRLGRLTRLPVADFTLKRWITVVHHRRKHLSRGIQALIEILTRKR